LRQLRDFVEKKKHAPRAERSGGSLRMASDVNDLWEIVARGCLAALAPEQDSLPARQLRHE
jgi:hypothetical protein